MLIIVIINSRPLLIIHAVKEGFNELTRIAICITTVKVTANDAEYEAL
jgi:hypothetical protein